MRGGGVFTCGGSHYHYGRDYNRAHLGHGGNVDELMPRLVEALVDVTVVGTTAGGKHTVVWTDDDKVYSFGYGLFGQLWHGR